jgi:hypothetical protein
LLALGEWSGSFGQGTSSICGLPRVGAIGGMGEVWLAEQKQPVRRRVALKLVKAGMDTREVIARFESERQALALLDHPAITEVFDAGSTTPEGHARSLRFRSRKRRSRRCPAG